MGQAQHDHFDELFLDGFYCPIDAYIDVVYFDQSNYVIGKVIQAGPSHAVVLEVETGTIRVVKLSVPFSCCFDSIHISDISLLFKLDKAEKQDDDGYYTANLFEAFNETWDEYMEEQLTEADRKYHPC